MEADLSRHLFHILQRELPVSGVPDHAYPYMAVTVDSLLSGVHFPVNTRPEWIAHKALAVNLSDLAAMGAMPQSVILGLVLPEWDDVWVTQFVQGFHDLQSRWNIHFILGDVKAGPLSVTIQALGGLNKNSAMLRSAAQPNDFIFVTNTIGDAACALSYLMEDKMIPSPYKEFFEQRFNRPQPQIVAGLCLVDIANAAIDISDGLASDLGHILEKSRVGAIIDIDVLPASTALQALVTDQQRLIYQLSGGDDYELCFTVSPEKCDEMQKRMSEIQVNCTQIGKIVPGHEICYQQNGKAINIEMHGYDHFKQGN